jgi:hypothetical protein
MFIIVVITSGHHHIGKLTNLIKVKVILEMFRVHKIRYGFFWRKASI